MKHPFEHSTEESIELVYSTYLFGVLIQYISLLVVLIKYISLFCVLIQYNIQLAYTVAHTVAIIDDHSEQRNTLNISQNDTWNNS